MDKTQMLSEPYKTVEEVMVMFDWESRGTVIRKIKQGAFNLPDGSPGAYKMPSRTGPWRILTTAVEHYTTQIELSPEAKGKE